jgi:hypothetical protein
LGRFWVNVKHNKVKLQNEDRKKFLDLDPNCFHIRPMSDRAKNLTMEEKIDMLIAFYERNKRWPINTDIIDGLNIGNFKYNLVKHPERAVKTNRMNTIMALDQTFFYR